MILIYRWKSYNYRDIIDTFIEMGYEICIMEQELQNYDVDETFAERLDDALRRPDVAWDFVFSVNYFALIAEVCHNRQIPYVMWNCDNPMISMYHTSVFYATNYLFLFDLSSVQEFRAMGAPHVYHLPLAVKIDRLDALLGKHPITHMYSNKKLQKHENWGDRMRSVLSEIYIIRILMMNWNRH